MIQERRDFAAWLRSAPTSPLAAIAQQPIGPGLRLGPADSDLPLEGVPEHRLNEQHDGLTLSGPDGARAVSRGRPFRLGPYTLTVSGPGGRRVVTVFSDTHPDGHVDYYPVAPGASFTGRLVAPDSAGRVRLLGLDGVEVEAVEAGSVVVPVDGHPTRLRVRRLPTGRDESELEIFFRDATNGRETYPAGRFVVLIPAGEGLVRLDFNRARNPFCAYSSAYPCPAPWQGNVLPGPIRAGETYARK